MVQTPTAVPETSLDHARRIFAQSWRNAHPLPALYCAPAVAGVLILGLAVGQPGAAMLTAAGAFSAGFGAFQRFTRMHVGPILFASLLMAAATALGTVAAQSVWLDAVLAGWAALILGLGTGFGTGPWWVLLQGAIFLIISGAQPGDAADGLSRGAAVLLGGLVQAASVSLLRTAWPRGFPPLTAPGFAPAPERWVDWRAAARRVFRITAPEVRYGVLLGLATALGVVLGRRLALANGYWVAMTVLLVLRPAGRDTVTRGLLRISGTVLGAGAATLVIALAGPPPWILVALIAVSAWGAYAVQWVNYGTFSTCVTSYVAFLFALQGIPAPVVAAHRLIATLTGGLVAFAALAAARLWRRALAQAPTA